MIPKIPRKNNNKRAILLIHIFTCSFCQKCIKLTCTINITTSNTRDTINLAIKQCYNNNIIPMEIAISATLNIGHEKSL